MRNRLTFVCVLVVGATGCPGHQKVASFGPGDVASPVARPVPATQPSAPVTQPSAFATQLEQPADDGRVLVLEGTPEIPDAMRQRLKQYMNTRSAGMADLSADGKRVLIGTRFGDTSQVHLVVTPLGSRRQLTFENEPARGGSFVPGDKNAFLYTADTGGDEQHQIYRVDLVSGKKTQLTKPGSRSGSYLWSHDGKQLAFFSNARNLRDFDIWVSDGKSREGARRVVDAKGWFYPLDFSRDGKHLLVGEYISINESKIHSVDLASKVVTLITPPGDKAAYGDAVFSVDGKKVFITSDRGGEFLELYEVDLAKAAWRSLTSSIKWNVEGVAMSPNGRTIAFTINEGGISVLHLLDTRSRRVRPATGIPKGLISGLRYAAKADVLGFTFNGPKRPADAYTYDVRRRKLTRWTESEVGGLDPKTFVAPELIEFVSFDKLKIPAFYYKPAGAGPHPVIINIHGGPEGQTRPRFSSLTQFLVVEGGFAVLYPNVRGSNGYGKSYLQLDNGFKREDSVKDIGALLDWIKRRSELDASNVGVLGGSYGGYMVLASLVHFGDRIKAGVDIVGISNFVTFLENTADYRRDLRRVEYGDERDEKMRAHLEKISPLNSVGKIKSALFVAQGANDPRVPASEAQQIVNAVRSAGHDVWYMLAKNEGHGFRKKENRDIFTLLTALFFEKHLTSK